MPARVLIDEAAVGGFIRGPDGPVARRMMVVGQAVKDRTIASLKPGFPRDFLGPYVVKRWVDTPGGPAVRVGADRTRTQPHVIRGNPLLVFHWPKVGRVVYFRKVNHPGSNMAPYLAKKLLEALATIGGNV